MPEAVEVLNEPGLIAIEVTVPVTLQERAIEPPEGVLAGEAEKEEMVGTGLFTVTVMDVELAVLLLLSVAKA